MATVDQQKIERLLERVKAAGKLPQHGPSDPRRPNAAVFPHRKLKKDNATTRQLIVHNGVPIPCDMRNPRILPRGHVQQQLLRQLRHPDAVTAHPGSEQ